MRRNIKIGDLVYGSSENQHRGKVATVVEIRSGQAKVVYPDKHVTWEYCSLLFKPYTKEEREKIKNGIAVY